MLRTSIWMKHCMALAVKHGGDLTSGQGHCVQQALLLGETIHSLLDVVLDIGSLGDLDPTTQQKVAGIAGLTRPSLDMVCYFHGFIKFSSKTFEASDCSCSLLLALIGFLGSNWTIMLTCKIAHCERCVSFNIVTDKQSACLFIYILYIVLTWKHQSS